MRWGMEVFCPAALAPHGYINPRSVHARPRPLPLPCVPRQALLADLLKLRKLKSVILSGTHPFYSPHPAPPSHPSSPLPGDCARPPRDDHPLARDWSPSPSGPRLFDRIRTPPSALSPAPPGLFGPHHAQPHPSASSLSPAAAAVSPFKCSATTTCPSQSPPICSPYPNRSHGQAVHTCPTPPQPAQSLPLKRHSPHSPPFQPSPQTNGFTASARLVDNYPPSMDFNSPGRRFSCERLARQPTPPLGPSRPYTKLATDHHQADLVAEQPSLQSFAHDGYHEPGAPWAPEGDGADRDLNPEKHSASRDTRLAHSHNRHRETQVQDWNRHSSYHDSKPRMDFEPSRGPVDFETYRGRGRALGRSGWLGPRPQYPPRGAWHLGRSQSHQSGGLGSTVRGGGPPKGWGSARKWQIRNLGGVNPDCHRSARRTSDQGNTKARLKPEKEKREVVTDPGQYDYDAEQRRYEAELAQYHVELEIYRRKVAERAAAAAAETKQLTPRLAEKRAEAPPEGPLSLRKSLEAMAAAPMERAARRFSLAGERSTLGPDSWNELSNSSQEAIDVVGAERETAEAAAALLGLGMVGAGLKAAGNPVDSVGGGLPPDGSPMLSVSDKENRCNRNQKDGLSACSDAAKYEYQRLAQAEGVPSGEQQVTPLRSATSDTHKSKSKKLSKSSQKKSNVDDHLQIRRSSRLMNHRNQGQGARGGQGAEEEENEIGQCGTASPGSVVFPHKVVPRATVSEVGAIRSEDGGSVKRKVISLAEFKKRKMLQVEDQKNQ